MEKKEHDPCRAKLANRTCRIWSGVISSSYHAQLEKNPRYKEIISSEEKSFSLEYVSTKIESGVSFRNSSEIDILPLGSYVGVLFRSDASSKSSEEREILKVLKHFIPRIKIREIRLQMEKLSSLENGWLDGEGVAPSIPEIRWLALMFDNHYQNEKFIPYFYPTEEGNIQVEWTIEQREITLEIDLDKHQGYWHELDLRNNCEIDRDLDIDSVDDWNWISERIEAIE